MIDPQYPWTPVDNLMVSVKCTRCRRQILVHETYWKRGIRAGQIVKGLKKYHMFRWVRICVQCYEGHCK